MRGWLTARDTPDEYDEAWMRAAFATDSVGAGDPRGAGELGEAVDRLLTEFRRRDRDDEPRAGELLRLRPRRPAGGRDRGAVPPLSDRLFQAWRWSPAISQAGDAAWFVAFAWTAATVASRPPPGLVLGAGTIPRALTALYGGALADRYDAAPGGGAGQRRPDPVLLAGASLGHRWGHGPAAAGRRGRRSASSTPSTTRPR